MRSDSSTRLASMRGHIQQAVDDGLWPAAQFAVARHGEILAFESFGEARDDDRFCLFSTTKPIVASVMWQLLGEGLITLDTKVAEVWPGFAHHGKDTITLEHVLLHTCGLTNGAIDTEALIDRKARTAAIAEWQLEWEPGTRYEYHGFSAHWVLAELIQRLTGHDYREALRARVLDPLGLDRLELGVPKERQGDLRRVVGTGEYPLDALEAILGRRVEVAILEASDAVVRAVANDPGLIALGVPGANAFSDAASAALFYQELLHNTSELWRPDVLADATGRIRNTFPADPLRSDAPANRSIGLVIAGEGGGDTVQLPTYDAPLTLRPYGGRTSPRAFGHTGAGGQSTWADPETGLSFCLLTSGMDRDVVRDHQRHTAIESLVPEWA
ncbi:serine hydrolase domain-containing protein [Streptomyces sp. NPDC102384]|uniref:serine hydrolase domain-containing protein n=1 Tax=Streptomyces sp. NPDC102384 TaxID=3366166 RepID=UPI0037FDEE91